MKYRLIILLSLVFVTISSCNSVGELPSEIKKDLADKIRSKSIRNTWSNQQHIESKSVEMTNEYYKSTDFEPIWINDSSLNLRGFKLLELIGNAKKYGLHPAFYSYSEISSNLPDSLIDAELLLTNSFFLITSHLNSGFINPNDSTFQWIKSTVNFDHIKILNDLKSGGDFNQILDLQPKNFEYVLLQKSLDKYIENHKTDTLLVVKIPSIKTDSTKCYQAAKQALIDYQYLNDEELNDSLFIVALKNYQKMNGLTPDAIIGRWTSKVLSKTNIDRLYHAMVNLEKWRWKINDTIPTRRLWVNIPAYSLKIINKEKVKREHRIVVGTNITQTPEFDANLTRMVTNPFWHVPYSIASTEVLTGIKTDTAYLKSKGFKLFRDQKEVDPKAVDWTVVNNRNFRYHVRQDGGAINSLGRIKFLFPNKHAVFIHDTPSKSLFWNDIRTYSHGCVRLQEPFELAKSILSIDENLIVSDTLDSIMVRELQHVIELNDPIRVYIDYFTTVGDSSGALTFYPDVYLRDDKFIELIKQKIK